MRGFGNYCSSNIIKEGDVVFLFSTPRQIYPIKVEKGGFFDHGWGRFKHDDMISQAYGSRILSHNKKGYFIMLHPSCERWTSILPHRTQIIYTPDISMIIEMLDLKSGSVVVESGTGSASLTHSMARAVGASGRVFTFEYHPLRVEKARLEISLHGLDQIVTVTEGNVYESGFNIPLTPTDTATTSDTSTAIVTDEIVDAVFLDLPEPWKAIGKARKVLNKKKQTRICCFSPCIEQVEKTRAALIENGFTHIQMFECLQRSWEFKKLSNPSIGDRMEGNGRKRTLRVDRLESGCTSVVSAAVCPIEMKGHTAYLTFATHLPDIVK